MSSLTPGGSSGQSFFRSHRSPSDLTFVQHFARSEDRGARFLRGTGHRYVRLSPLLSSDDAQGPHGSLNNISYGHMAYTNAYNYSSSWSSRLCFAFRFLRFLGWTWFSLIYPPFADISAFLSCFPLSYTLCLPLFPVPSPSPPRSPLVLLLSFLVVWSSSHRPPTLSNIQNSHASVTNCRI